MKQTDNLLAMGTLALVMTGAGLELGQQAKALEPHNPQTTLEMARFIHSRVEQAAANFFVVPAGVILTVGSFGSALRSLRTKENA